MVTILAVRLDGPPRQASALPRPRDVLQIAKNDASRNGNVYGSPNTDSHRHFVADSRRRTLTSAAVDHVIQDVDDLLESLLDDQSPTPVAAT